MKKKISVIILAIALCLTAFFVTACDGKKNGEKTDYEWTYVKEFVDEHDADMTIDGELDEERWQDRLWLTHSESGVTVSYTTIFTEKGLYIGAIAQDPDMKWNARFNFSNNSNAANSAFWFNVEGPEVQDRHAMRAFNFFVDAFDSASRNQTRFEAKAKTNGDIMKFEATEMTAELFASWDALNIDVSDGLPEFVRIIPSYRYVKDVEDPNTCKWIKPIYTLPGGSYWDLSMTYDENLQNLNNLRPWSGMKFDSTGYINADKDDAVVGDAANGYAKSSGWDLTEIDNGIVKAYGPDEQAIFFKGINSSKYMVSAKMKLIGGATHAGGWVNKSPSGGLINMRDETESIAFYVSGKDILSGSNLGYHTINKYTGWTDVYEGYCSKPEGFNAETDTIELKCIKYDENLFYFINGSLVLIKRVDWLQGDACPGLYGLSAEVEFSDFAAKDYEDDADALKAIISEYAYEVNVTSGDGGFVTVDKTELRKGDDLVVTITPSAGYVLSSFKINGVDRYDYVVDNANGGKVTFTDITEDSTIEATFAQLSGGVRVLGKITSGGKAVTTSEITLKSPTDKRVSYTVSATSNGSFSFMLSPAGTYTIGDKTITLDGNYVISIKTEGYRDKTVNVTIGEDDKTLRIPDIEIEKYVVGGSVTISGKTYNSGKTNWDMTNEADSVIRALKGSNCSLVYFTDKTGTDAAIDFTITNKTVITDSAYETQPCMGVSIGNGSNRFDIFILNEGLRISPRGGWNNDEKAYNVSVPVSYSLRTKESPETLTFRLVRSGSYVALLYKNGDNYVEIWRTNDSSLEKMSAYAFTVCQSNTCDLEFSNYSIKLGDEAKDYIEKAFYETVTLSDYDTTKGTVTIEGANESGKVKHGDSFSVVVDSQKITVVSYNGETKTFVNGGVAKFVAVKGVDKVFVEIVDKLETVTGTVSLDPAFGTPTVDYSGTTLTFVSEEYTFTFDGVVKADGTFEVELPAGEYSVSATHPSYYAKATTVTVSEESETVAVKFELSAVTDGSNNYTVAADGTLTGHSGYQGSVENYIFGEAEAFTIETHIAPLDLTKDDYARAGLVVITPAESYRLMLSHVTLTPEWRVVFRYGSTAIHKNITDLGNGLTLKLDYNGSMLKAYVNGELFGTFTNGYTNGNFTIGDDAFGGAIKAGLTSVGTAGVFTDYKFIPREVKDIVTLADYDTNQGTVTITKTTEKIKYGDKFTVGVSVVGERRVAMVTYGGKTVSLKNGETAEFTANTEGKVSVEFETMVTATGTVSLDSAFGTPTVDYSGTKLTFVSSKYTFTFDNVVNSDGTFEVELPAGEYSVSATHSSYYAKATTVTISEGSATVAVKFNLSAITSGSNNYTVAADGTLTGSVGNDFYFGEAAAFTLETHIAPLDLTNDRYARAGLVVVTPVQTYRWMLRHAQGSTPEWWAMFRYDETNGSNKIIYKEITDLGKGLTLKLDYNGSMLKVYVNGELFETLTNGYTNGNFVIADGSFGGAIKAGLTNVGTAGVFTDYKFIPREVTDIVTLADYDTDQGTVTITKTTDTIKYGDKFTVTVGGLDDQKRAKVTYGNKTVSLKNGDTAEFTADIEGEVTVEFVSLGTLYVSTVDFYEYETNGVETVTKTVKVSADVDGTVGIAGATFNNLPDGVTVETGSTAGEYVLTVPVAKIDELVKSSDVTVAFDGATDAKVTFNYNAAILKDTAIYSNIDTVSKKSTNKQGGQVFTGIDLGTDSFTVAFMAHNLNRIGTGGGYILFSTGNTDVSKGINVYANKDKFRFRCAGVAGNFPIAHNVSQYTDWTHLAFTFDRSVAGKLTITVYVNYVKVGSTTQSLTTDETFTYGDSKNFVVGSINGEMWKENGAMAETNQYNLSAAGVTIYRGVAPIDMVKPYFEDYLNGMKLPADAVQAKFTFADGTTANSVSGSSVTMAKKAGTTEPVEGKDGGDDKAVQINSKSDYYDVNGFDVSTGSFAVSMDLKMDFTTELTYGGSGIVLFATTDPDATSGLAVSIRKNTIRVRINGSTVFFEYLNLDVCTGKWTNITVAFVRENGKCSITVYVNNAPEETKTIELDDSVSLSGTDNAGYLGIGNGSPAYQSSQDNTHTIDNVTLISGAITAENMFALMNN